MSKLDNHKMSCVNWVVLALSLALFFVFCWPYLSLLSDIYATEDDYSHAFMVPIISAYAAHQIYREGGHFGFRACWWGIPLLLLGLLTVVFGHWYNIALFPPGLGVGFLCATGFLLCVIGIVVLIGGLTAVKVFSFPIAYLVFAIPFPKSLTLPVTLWLRSIVSVVSEWLVRGVGISIYREGNVLNLANASLGVADACSGVRSFWMLMAGAAALAYIFRMGWTRSVLLCGLTLPISIGMNVLRVFATAVLVVSFGPQYASGWRHSACGWFTFILGLTLLILTAYFLGKSCVHNAEQPKSSPPSSYTSAPVLQQIRPYLALICVLFALGVSAHHLISDYYDSRDNQSFISRKALSEFPEVVDAFVTLRDDELLESHLDILRPTDYLVRSYTGIENQRVQLRILYWKPLRYRREEQHRGINNHIPDVCYPSWGYERVRANDASMNIGEFSNVNVAVRQFRKSDEDQCILFWYKGGGNRLTKGDLKERTNYLVKSIKEPFLNHGSQYVLTIAVDIGGSFENAQKIAIQFAESIIPLLPQFGIK